jgi:hypothetical protein
VSGNDGSGGDDLQETTRKQNSTLQSLIDVIGNLLAASRELLGRLQEYTQKEEPPVAGAPPATPGELPEHPADNAQRMAAGLAPDSHHLRPI